MPDEKPSCDVIINELGHITANVKMLKIEVDELRDKVSSLKEAFRVLDAQSDLIRRVVYGVVGLVLVSVVGTALMIVLRSEV